MENKNILNHVVVIPDGNRRWAKENNLKAWEGHQAGSDNFEILMEESLKLGIKSLSIWGASLNNLEKRPLLEVNGLIKVFENSFQKLLENKEIHKNEVKINIIGHWKEKFPKKLVKLFEEIIEKTKSYNKHTLNFFLAYNGDDDMQTAIKNIIDSGIPANKVSPEIIKSNLMTKNLPAVDFMIRTGGEPHLSTGFLMWDTANSQLYFTDKYFPDFNASEFRIAIEEYQSRQRRKGK